MNKKIKSSKKGIGSRLKKIIRSPAVTMGIGISLVICGIFETAETALEDFLHVEIGAGHGMLIFGAVQILHAIVIAIEGLENVGVAAEEQKLEKEISEDEAVLKQMKDR